MINKGNKKMPETEVRVRISGRRYGKIMALKELMNDRSFIPSAVRTCVVYYSRFGKYPVIGAVSPAMIEKAEQENDKYDTSIKFPRDKSVDELLEMLSLSGKIGMQLLIFAERCIDTCEEGEEWGCGSRTLQEIMFLGYKEKNGLLAEEEFQRIVSDASAVHPNSQQKKKEELPEPTVRDEKIVEDQEPQEDIIENKKDSEFVSIFVESDQLDLKGFKDFVTKSNLVFTPELLRDWVNHLKSSGLEDFEKRIKLVRVFAANSGTDSGW
jgi:hypothetical protein